MLQSTYAENAAGGDYLFATRSGSKIPLYGGCGANAYFTIACTHLIRRDGMGCIATSARNWVFAWMPGLYLVKTLIRAIIQGCAAHQ